MTASKIPINSIVSKKTGTYKYKLVDEILVYDVDGNKLSIDGKGKDVLYLLPTNNINQSNSISTISGLTELVWHTTSDDLCSYFNRINDDE